uniref:Uncharacterized protein n=1 Tax=Arundo donax TaxID=35708 RepID=A0A0A9GFZ6_ARUDO
MQPEANYEDNICITPSLSFPMNKYHNFTIKETKRITIRHPAT